MMLADDAELWLLPCHVLMKKDVRCHIYLSVLACVKVWYATNRRAGYVDNNSTTYNIHMTQYIYILRYIEDGLTCCSLAPTVTTIALLVCLFGGA